MPKQTSYFQIRSGQIFKLPSCYDVRMNEDIQVLIAKFNEVLAILDKGEHNQENLMDKKDSLVCHAK